jgi:hypothetical protein
MQCGFRHNGDSSLNTVLLGGQGIIILKCRMDFMLMNVISTVLVVGGAHSSRRFTSTRDNTWYCLHEIGRAHV